MNERSGIWSRKASPALGLCVGDGVSTVASDAAAAVKSFFLSPPVFLELAKIVPNISSAVSVVEVAGGVATAATGGGVEEEIEGPKMSSMSPPEEEPRVGVFVGGMTSGVDVLVVLLWTIEGEAMRRSPPPKTSTVDAGGAGSGGLEDA